MPETTLALPLSGEEVIESIVARIRMMLRQDCFLSPMTAYEAFSGSVHVQLRMRDIGRMPEVDVTVPVGGGRVEDINEDSALIETDAFIEELPPNEVRVESGQSVPALVETEDGRREIKGIRYT